MWNLDYITELLIHSCSKNDATRLTVGTIFLVCFCFRRGNYHGCGDPYSRNSSLPMKSFYYIVATDFLAIIFVTTIRNIHILGMSVNLKTDKPSNLNFRLHLWALTWTTVMLSGLDIWKPLVFRFHLIELGKWPQIIRLVLDRYFLDWDCYVESTLKFSS